MRILIVEDEQALRESIVEQLKEAGFNVDAAADGEEGLYCGREYALDLAIIDLGLPKLPGPGADPQAARRSEDRFRS